MARAMTAGELTDIRIDGQFSSLFLAIHKPAQVYTALVNQTFTTDDKITQVTYDAGSGTLANVLPGMTMYISAVGYGLSDLGRVRIRKTPTSTIFYIGEDSDIAWADDLFLTVVDEFGIWARHLAIDAATKIAYMDYDIAYSDQHTNASPIPCIGPRYIPVWLTGATIAVPFDASLSSVLGSSITGYSWAAPGASATAGLTTATPTITYNAVGLYRVACTLTAANGKTTTAYAYVQVYDRINNLPVTQFDLSGCTGSWDQGGWNFKVTMYAQADTSTVVDRAMVCLFARDFYGTAGEVSIGPIANRENIIAIGWIDGESIVEDPDGNSIEFTVSGIGLWLKKLPGFPIGIQNTNSTPTVWTSWKGLTVDDSMYHLFYWQSTIIPAVDVFMTGDTRVSGTQYAPGDVAIADQIVYLLKNTIMANAISDRFNRLFCEIDTQVTPPASRSGFPVVLTLQYYDWREQMKMDRITTPPTSQVNLSGVVVTGTSTAKAIFALAPGHIYLPWGSPMKQDRMLLSSQAQAQQLAAMKLAWDNHQLEFEIDLAGNNRMVDIVPHEYVGLVVASGDTPRGFTFNGNIIVREVNISLDKSKQEDNTFIQISWKAENETQPANSSVGDAPANTTPARPPSIPLPSLPPMPTIGPNPNGAIVKNVLMNVATGNVGQAIRGIFFTQNFDAANPNWLGMNDGLPIAGGTLDAFAFLDVAPLSGKIFGFVDGAASADNDGVWYAPGLGQTWTQILSHNQICDLLGIAHGSTDVHVQTLGVNRGVLDEVCVIIRHGTAQPYYVKGTSAGFPVLGVATATAVIVGGTSQMVFGNGRWLSLVPESGFHYHLNWCNRDASVAARNATEILVRNYPNLMRGAADGPVAYLIGVDVGADHSTIIKTSDNGDNFAEVGTYKQETTALNNVQEKVYPSPNGSYLLAADEASIQAFKSGDSGSTWGTIGLAGNYTCFESLSDSNHWIMSGPTHLVYYSADGGVTWADHTGDLWNILAVPGNWNPVQIRGW